jgi:hypothetical protein
MNTRLERYWTRYAIGLISIGGFMGVLLLSYSLATQPKETFTAVKHGLAPWTRPHDWRAVKANCNAATATDAEIEQCIAEIPPLTEPLTDAEQQEIFRRYGLTD